MTSLRKRHFPPQSVNDIRTSASSSHSQSSKRNYLPIAVYAVIFWSSPLLLLLAIHTHLPADYTRHLNAEHILQQQALLRSVENTKLQAKSATKSVISPVRKDANMTDPSPTRVPVVVWPYLEYGAGTAELQHFAENGIQESPMLELSKDLLDVSPNVVWIGDFGFTFKANRWCDAYHEKIIQAKELRRQLNLSLTWPVFVVDWSDRTNTPRCTQIEDELGCDNVHYSIRSIVKDRTWNSDTEWVNVGRIQQLEANYNHVPLFVRTDTVETLENVLQEQYDMNLASPIERIRRPIDVSHFWPLDLKGVKDAVHAKLRQKVSHTIVELANTSHLQVFVCLAGNALQAGRRQVQSAYIEAMLNTKIIVVTQRDDWEDHYRLFEALVSGAMVMTDRMLSLPSGLQNGTSIVEFESAEDLRQKIMYYVSHSDERLDIARKGREVSMSQHRTFHRVEQVVFGKVVSDCSRTRPESQCPWILHANEA